MSFLYDAKENVPGTVVEMSCKAGFYISSTGATRGTCLASGKYTLTQKPVCKACTKGCMKCTASTCLACFTKNPSYILIGGKCTTAAPNCKVLKALNQPSGIYKILGASGKVFETYCDMKVNGGGWQLIASVHEDNIRGKCTAKDFWTNDNGNNGRGVKGLGNWQSKNIKGSAANACKDDFKSPGYFDTKAKDVMVWHVPNNTPMNKFYDNALYRYYTKTGILSGYAGTFYGVYQKYPPIAKRSHCRGPGTGPYTRVTYDKGTMQTHHGQDVATNSRGESWMGYIQFTVYNNERSALAFCPGMRYHGCNSEHACIGGGGYFLESSRQCSDFSGWDWDGYGRSSGYSWSASKRLTDATVMIFTRQ